MRLFFSFLLAYCCFSIIVFVNASGGISVNLINLRLKRVEFVEIRRLLQLQNISNH